MQLFRQAGGQVYTVLHEQSISILTFCKVQQQYEEHCLLGYRLIGTRCILSHWLSQFNKLRMPLFFLKWVLW